MSILCDIYWTWLTSRLNNLAMHAVLLIHGRWTFSQDLNKQHHYFSMTSSRVVNHVIITYCTTENYMIRLMMSTWNHKILQSSPISIWDTSSNRHQVQLYQNQLTGAVHRRYTHGSAPRHGRSKEIPEKSQHPQNITSGWKLMSANAWHSQIYR